MLAAQAPLLLGLPGRFAGGAEGPWDNDGGRSRAPRAVSPRLMYEVITEGKAG